MSAAQTRSAKRPLGGWGRFPIVESETHRPERLAELAQLVASGGTLLGRGLGRAYGDAALNGAGKTVLFERLNRLLSFDAETGILHCEAGVSLADLLDVFAPRGFLPPVCPGTQFVTIGGAVACDIHGKNHHVDGSLGHHIRELRIVNAQGELVTCSPTQNPELFQATIGGMGLTGLIAEVKLQLRRIGSRYVSVDYDRAPDLDQALQLLGDTDRDYTYSVAWIDCLARGRSLGRSVLMRGNPVAAESAPGNGSFKRKRGARVPFDFPAIALNPLTIRAFNSLYYRRHPAMSRGVMTDFAPFFFPLDSIQDWNRIYGKRGFTQYQFLLPRANGRAGLVRILERARHGAGSFLAVLKQFGDAPPAGMLSFPRGGYTLALDFPVGRPGLLKLLDDLDEIVIEHGGRVYLAKDARMRADAFAAMYPELPAFLAAKREFDPQNKFTSDLARRLGLEA